MVANIAIFYKDAVNLISYFKERLHDINYIKHHSDFGQSGLVDLYTDFLLYSRKLCEQNHKNLVVKN